MRDDANRLVTAVENMLAEYEPSVHINAGKRQYVYPVAYFRALAAGEPVTPPPPDVLRVIVREWLAGLGVSA